MSRFVFNSILISVTAVLMTGCGMYHRKGLAPARAQQIEQSYQHSEPRFTEEQKKKILALNPKHVSEQDVRTVLANTPAPHIINIHGGIASVIPRMVSFSEFLIGMGYPAISLTNPSDGTYSFSCYESSRKIAGVIAWYYEKDGLRPMMVGHSQGGIQAVKILDKFAGPPSSTLNVWNPLTWEKEARTQIVDPLTGKTRPVVGLQLPYTTSVGAGGLTRLLPNQWDMLFRLRTIPDSVEEFTGFCKEYDILGGDFMGYGSANEFESGGTATVRNVWLPMEYNHGEIPDSKHLLDDPAMVDWINHYQPDEAPVSHAELDVEFDGDNSHILWAADVWYSIKKHWVIELQRLIRARPGSKEHP